MSNRRGHGPGGNLMVQKPKDGKKTLLRLLRYLSDRRAAMALILLISLFGALVSIVATRLNGIIIDDFVVTKDVLGLARICLVLLAIYLTNIAAQYLQQRTMVRVAQETTARMRTDLFEHMSTLKLSYFDTHNSGDLMSRLTNDVDTISMTLSQSVAQLFSGVVSLLGTFVAMLLLSPLLTLISVVTMPLMFFCSRSFPNSLSPFNAPTSVRPLFIWLAATYFASSSIPFLICSIFCHLLALMFLFQTALQGAPVRTFRSG